MILPTPSLNLLHFYDKANEALQQGSVAGKQLNFTGFPGSLEVKSSPRYFLSKDQKRENSRVWAQFRRAGMETLGEEKFSSILTKYEKQVGPLKKGDPLLIEHIQYVYATALQLTTTELKRGEEKIRDLSNRELGRRVCSQSIPLTEFPHLAGVPSKKEKALRINHLKHECHKAIPFALQHVQSLQPLQKGELEQIQKEKAFCGSKFAVWLEECCRKTVNYELDKKMLIPALCPLKSTVDFYKVYRKIAANGLVAYALRPATSDSKLPPLIVFRGTQWKLGAEDALSSLYDDTYADIGKRGWGAAQGEFERLMQDPKFLQAGQQVTVAGYSLGGVHAQNFVARYANRVARLVTYNSPGVNRSIAESFANSAQIRPLQIHVIRTKKDFCHSVGDCHLGLGVPSTSNVQVQLLEFDYSGEKQVLGRHRAQIFKHTERVRGIREVVSAEELNIELDTAKRGPEVKKHRTIHKKGGGVIRGLLLLIEGILYLVKKILRIDFLRTN